MSADVPEPVDAPKDAPVAPTSVPDAADPKQEAAPVTVETVPTPGTKRGGRKLDRAQDQSEMARALMRTKIDEMDRNILDLQEEIDNEEDTGKQAKMREKLAEKVGEREEAFREYKEMTRELDRKIDEIKKELAKIDGLKREIVALKDFIETNKGTLDKAKITELAAKTRTLDDKEKELKKLSPEGHEEDLKATLHVYQAERTRIQEDQERRDEIGEADRALEVGMAEALGEPVPPAADKSSAEAAPKSGEPALTGKEKELILDNKIDQIAFDLAKLLATNVPTDTDTYGQFTFQAKRGLLMVLSYCGGDPAWTENLTEKEKNDLGMSVTTKTDEKGNVLHTIKWEPLDFSLNKVQNVYEVAFGKNGWTKEMGELTPKTTLKELKDRAANFETDTKVESEVAMLKFIRTLEGLGATPESGVQEFVIKNSDKIIKVYKPETGTTSTEAGAQGNEQAEFNVDNVVKVIGEKKFHKKTSFKDVLSAVDTTWTAPAELSAEAISAKAKADVDGFTTAESLTSYQAAFKKSARAASMLGLPDTSLAMDASFAKALAELKAGNPLTETTKTELKNGIETQTKLVQEYISKPFYEILEKQKSSAEGQDLADLEKVMAALDKNPVPGTPEAPTK